jgi:hypothetical protein
VREIPGRTLYLAGLSESLQNDLSFALGLYEVWMHQEIPPAFKKSHEETRSGGGSEGGLVGPPNAKPSDRPCSKSVKSDPSQLGPRTRSAHSRSGRSPPNQGNYISTRDSIFSGSPLVHMGAVKKSSRKPPSKGPRVEIVMDRVLRSSLQLNIGLG